MPPEPASQKVTNQDARLTPRSHPILASDETKAELRILGVRYGMLDVGALCRHLDTCAGSRIAETLINNHERRLAKEDVAKMREEDPKATVQEIVDVLIEGDRLTGMGLTKVKFPENSSEPVRFEMWNPIVTATEGAARALILSYWAGALSALLDGNLEAADVLYDKEKNCLTCSFMRR